MKKNCFKFKSYSQSQLNNGKVSYIELNQTLYASALSNKYVGNNMWIIDSGSSTHMSGDEDLCKHFSKAIKPIDVQVGNGSVLQAISVGDIIVNVNLPNGGSRRCTLKDVLYVPNLAFNLLSVSKLTKNNYSIVFRDNKCNILNKNEELMAVAYCVGQLYYLCLLYTSPSPRDKRQSRMPSSA